jgi:hypothetical protein
MRQHISFREHFRRGNALPIQIAALQFEITHIDVIPATINELDFQQTAYAAMFAYRDASQHDRGLESFRIVNWILAANVAIRGPDCLPFDR